MVDASGRDGHRMEAGAVSIHYRLFGEGDPLLLLHAGSLTGDMWQPYLDAFASRYRVVVPDMPGHGRSGAPTRAMSYRHLADDIAAFVQALGLQKPLVAGFSDGGQVALEIAMRHPALPRAIAIGGVWFEYGDAYRAFVRNALGDEESEFDATRFAGDHPRWAAWLDRLYGPGGWTALMAGLKQMWLTPLNYTARDFAAIAAPALILVGDRDELVPVEEAARLYRRVPVAELAVIPGADHGAFFSEKVAPFRSLMMDFFLRQ